MARSPKRAWGKSVADAGVKEDNNERYLPEKVGIRQRVLDEIGSQAVIFDGFAGSGLMYRSVWKDAAGGCVGCDMRWFRDERTAYVADNRVVLRTIDLSRFTIFDFDAYGSPWTQVLILASRRRLQPSERIGLVVTDGSSFKLRLGGMPRDLSALVGARMNMAGAARNGRQLVLAAAKKAAMMMGGEITRAWFAQGKTGAQVIYAGFVIEALPLARSGS